MEWRIWLPDESYSISDIFKRNRKKTDSPSIRIYLDKIKNRTTFKIRAGYYLEL